jgi:hypothetical protein
MFHYSGGHSGVRVKLLSLALSLYGVITPVVAEAETLQVPFKRIWQRSNGDVSAVFKGVVSHPPAFVGEDGMRARLQLLNNTKQPIFIQAFDLRKSKKDSALLHDVFGAEPCNQALTNPQRSDNSDGVLAISYSRLHTSSIVAVRPGKSFEFSVPLDHLSRDTCVRIRYWASERAVVLQEATRFLWIGASF